MESIDPATDARLVRCWREVPIEDLNKSSPALYSSMPFRQPNLHGSAAGVLPRQRLRIFIAALVHYGWPMIVQNVPLRNEIPAAEIARTLTVYRGCPPIVTDSLEFSWTPHCCHRSKWNACCAWEEEPEVVKAGGQKEPASSIHRMCDRWSRSAHKKSPRKGRVPGGRRTRDSSGSDWMALAGTTVGTRPRALALNGPSQLEARPLQHPCLRQCTSRFAGTCSLRHVPCA